MICVEIWPWRSDLCGKMEEEDEEVERKMGVERENESGECVKMKLVRV